MTTDSLIPDDFKSKIGEPWELGVYEIEKGMVRRFARAVDDPNPRWDTMAPPTFIVTLGGEEFGKQMMTMFRDGLLHGSTELECYQPVRPGDSITVSGKIASIRERSQMAFVTFEITYTNQKQELVARCQQTMIGYQTEKTRNG
jgi:acyl dehydratase